MRTFLAVEVPENIRRVICDFVQIVAKKEVPIKWVKLDNMHITLKFLGEIDENKRADITPVITEVSRQHSPFTVEMEDLGCFPHARNPRVIWLGMKHGGEELSVIAADLEKELTRFGFKEEKIFHPHLTIGRMKKFCRVEEILAQTISTEPFTVASLVLFKSVLKPEGPIYTALDYFPFS
jgi:2'-5' RNA ligase